MEITGSVQYEDICPNCGAGDCEYDVNYRTGEGIILCSHCGYLHQMHYNREEAGEYILEEPTQEAHPNNQIPVERKIESPHGYCEVRLEKGCSCYGLEKEESYQQLLSEALSDSSVKSVILHRYEDGLYKTITVSRTYERTEK